MISNYEIECGYYNLELEPIIYLIPQWASKIIYTDGYNEAVFQGDSTNVTCIKGFDINFTEESSFDERFKFTKSVSIKVNGYMNFSDLYNRFTVILKTKREEYYLVNSDFPSFVTHTYTLNANANETELVFSSQSNIATLKLTNFEPNNVNSCKEYSTSKIKNVKLTESWASSLSTWQKSLINKGTFSDIEPLQDSISLTEEFDGEKYTVTLCFDIPMSHFKNDWHIKLLQFEENKYRGYIQLEDGHIAFVGYNGGLFPSYNINGDIISIRLQEVAIRGISYGNDYAAIDTNIPSLIEFEGAGCNTYYFESTCNWYVEHKPEYITITPSSGNGGTRYTLSICNTDDVTGHETSEFIIKSCNAIVKADIIVINPMYRFISTEETVCVEPITRTVSGDPYCVGYDKYVDVTNEISYNSGTTWEFVSSSSTLYDINCYDCGFTPEVYNYLTFIPLETTKFKFIGSYEDTHEAIYIDTLDYSLDSGQTWTEVGDAVRKTYETRTVNAGQRIMWKYHSKGTSSSIPIGSFRCSKPFVVAGVLHSIYGKGGFNYYRELFKGLPVVSARDLILENDISGMWNGGIYEGMFAGCSSLTEAPKLPSTSLAVRCYKRMFANCTSLTKAPILPATIIDIEGTANRAECYEGMFSGCTSLNTITCLLTEISKFDMPATTNWVSNVAENGTFYKNPNMNDWPTGDNGIPSGWTVVNYTG